MHAPHLSSGGRYPVLRTLAILYLFAAAMVLFIGVWRAIAVLVSDAAVADPVFGATTGASGKLLVSMSWLAASFIGVLAMFGIAELVKLFIDIEHNTRLAAMRSAAVENRIGAGDVVVPTTDNGMPATAAATTTGNDGVGEGVPGGGRIGQLLEGEETAEGALIRGH